MSLDGAKLHLCSCNGTMPLDRDALARALELSATPAVRSMLCQKELAAFAGAATGDVIVGCTQEAKLFTEVAEQGARAQTIRFVNIRETGGWSVEARQATQARMMFVDEPGKRVLVAAPKRIDDRRLLGAHGEVTA